MPYPRTARHRGLNRVTVTALTGVLLAGCSTKTTTDSTSAGGLATGPGVSATTINLGVLSDHTGPFAAAGKGIEQGRHLFWDAKNTAGGVCHRQVEFTTMDHGYNTQTAVTDYSRISGNVLALDELLGSPEIAALMPSLAADRMLTFAAGFSSSVLSNPYVVITGTTYDIEMINGVQWLAANRGLSRGDKIGHIYLEGDYGGDALVGSRAVARDLGLQLLEYQVTPTDQDLTGQITALRAAGAKVVLLSTTPAQTASAVGVAAASGYDATFLGSDPSFDPALLAGPVKSALEQHLFVAQSVAPFSATDPGPTQVRTEFAAKYAGQPESTYVMYGYAQGEIMAKILETACADDNLTRAGLLKAYQSLSSVDTAGLIAKLDFSKTGQIPARQIYIVRPDATAAGGTTIVAPLFDTPSADSYQFTG